MLDTNIVSDLVRHPHGRIATRIAEVGETRVCTSIIVAAELRSAAARKASPQMEAQLESVLRAIEIGQPIGANDLFVAAHALALRCTLVTDSEREFARIKALAVENWLR